MYSWEIFLFADDDAHTIRTKHNIKSFEEALNEALDLVEILRLEFFGLGLDCKLSFAVTKED